MTTSAPADLTMFVVEHLPLSRLQPNTGNVRKDLGDLTDLTDSIRAQGVLQPAVVAPSPTASSKYVLITGHRRHAAAKAAGLKRLPCVIREDLDTQAKQIEAMLVENAQRLDLTPIEEGDAYQQLLDLPDYSVKQLATRLGHPQTFIRNRVKVASTPARIRAGVVAGQITLDQALVFAEAADHDDLVKKLESALGTYNWQWQVQAVRDSIRARRELATRGKQLEKQGVTPHPSLTAAAKSLGGDAPRIEPLTTLGQWAEEKAYEDQLAALPDDVDDDVREKLEDEYASGKLVPPALTDDGHASCPGRIVYRQGDHYFEACSQPHLHDDLTGGDPEDDGDGSSPSAEDSAAAAAEAKQVEADLATAADVRLRHVLQVAKDPSSETARAFALDMATGALSSFRGTDARAALGVDVDEASEGQEKYEAVRSVIADWSFEQLVTVTRLVEGQVFSALLTENDWRWGGTHRIRAIAATGYTWSEVERQMLSRAGEPFVAAAGLAGDGDAE